MKPINDALTEMEKSMSKESIERSNEIFERELFLVELSRLREIYKVKQSEIKGFTQPSISRIESRSDIKMSTLIKYLGQMGLQMEIVVKPKNTRDDVPDRLVILQS